MDHQKIFIVDFGGPFAQIIGRKVREAHVYCEIIPYTKAFEAIQKEKPVGLIFTGGSDSVYDENPPRITKEVYDLGIPILGICYGMQLIADDFGGEVNLGDEKEFGKTRIQLDTTSPFFENLMENNQVWMSHHDMVMKLPEGFQTIGSTDLSVHAAMANHDKHFYGVQFHPELPLTFEGKDMLNNFLYKICGCTGDWTMEHFAAQAVEEIKKDVGDGKVLLGLSGGVDSSVCAKLISKAIGKQLSCIFVDTGLMRKNEGDEVEEAFKNSDVNFIRVEAQDRFLGKLKGITDPEQKRKIIGEEFIRVFEEEAKKIGEVDFLGQGTIYPDII